MHNEGYAHTFAEDFNELLLHIITVFVRLGA